MKVHGDQDQDGQVENAFYNRNQIAKVFFQTSIYMSEPDPGH